MRGRINYNVISDKELAFVKGRMEQLLIERGIHLDHEPMLKELAEAGCIIFAEGVKPDAATIEKAKAQNMTLLATELPVFEAALAVNQELMK